MRGATAYFRASQTLWISRRKYGAPPRNISPSLKTTPMRRDACNTGYQGFQGFSLRPPPALKPGETLESRRTKFHHAGVASCKSVPQMRDVTVSAIMSDGLALSDYNVPDRRGVSAAFSAMLLQTKPCTGRTLSRQSYCSGSFDVMRTTASVLPPAWLCKKNTKPIVSRQTKSTYQMDLGMAGESPACRPYVAKTGMASTTMDLNEGTAKATYHIPGYSGHIPYSTYNHTVRDQAEGRTARPRASNLRLYHQHNLPGYTGHNPSNAKNDKGPRFSGSDPLTSSGAMAAGEVL